MEVKCYCQRIVGGQGSQDETSRAKRKGALTISLLSSGKDISAHAQSVGVTNVELEISLILARVSMFTATNDISRMTICPPHRSSLGTYWVAKRLSSMPRVRNIIESYP